MILIPHKAKQFLVLVVKLLIVAGAFYFIYQQLTKNEKLEWQKFAAMYQENQSVGLISSIIFLTFLNRFLEILKWQNLIKSFSFITIWQSTTQVLAALTAGIFTPNGVGEYAGKALYYPKNDAGKIVFLNLICNGIQMIITIVMGLISLLYFNILFEAVPNSYIYLLFGSIIILCILLFSFKSIAIKGYSLALLFTKINSIPKAIHRKNIVLGIGRYVTIVHQYYLLLLLFDVQLPYFQLLATVAVVYFLASSLPTFQFLDFAVKGSVALFFFGYLGINEWIVLLISTLIWILNVVIPVILGSFFVLTYKPSDS